MNVPPIERPFAQTVVHAFLHWQQIPDVRFGRESNPQPAG
jgi:hypothetical protein